VKQQKSEVSVETGGGAAQVIVNSPHAVQTVGGNQTGAISVDLIQLRQDLQSIRAAIMAAPLESGAKDELEDAVLSVEREANAQVQTLSVSSVS